jgi:methyl-accepting chemotaxis protein
MDKLTDDIQRTIRALENLSGRASAASEAIDELLDQLFQQKIDLAGSSYSTASAVYQLAVQSMSAAANKAERAVKDPNSISAMVPVIEDAIGKLARLLDSVAHTL